MNNNSIRRLDLKLSASSGAWRLYSARQADPAFKPFQERIFQRDQYICQFCGFQSKKYQTVVNIDNNYMHNKMDNLATACCFCSQCCFIESVGVGGYGGGSLIYLPEISQAELNTLCHVLFCAITNDTGYKASAQTIYLGFKVRSQSVEEVYGEGTSDPAILGHLLIDSGPLSDEQQARVFNGLRLLPSRAKFRVQIEAWAANALKEMSEK